MSSALLPIQSFRFGKRHEKGYMTEVAVFTMKARGMHIKGDRFVLGNRYVAR